MKFKRKYNYFSLEKKNTKDYQTQNKKRRNPVKKRSYEKEEIMETKEEADREKIDKEIKF